MFAFLRHPRWLIPGLLLLFTLFFYWKILFTNRVMFPWDAGDFFYPLFAFVHEELRHLRLPLWSPYWFGGFPVIADPEAQTFYPPNWLMLLVRPFAPLTYKLVEMQIIGHFFLAGLCMYALAKDYTRDTLSALLGGVLFMSSGAMVAHTEHLATISAMAWYPLALLLSRRGLLERNWRWTVSAGFVFGLINLTGHWQHAVYLGLLLFLFFTYEACFGPERRRLWPHWIAHLATIAAIGAGLAMIQILPTYELSALSIRTQLNYYDVTNGNDPRYFWTLFLPNYFGGINGVPYREPVEPSMYYVFLTVAGCLLAVVGLIEMARRRNFFWLLFILACADASVGRNGHLADLVYRVPVLNLFRHMTTYFDLASFALCLMAAIGAWALTDREARRWYQRWLPLAVLALAVFAVAIGMASERVRNIPDWYLMLAALWLVSLVLAASLRDKLPQRVTQVALLALVVLEVCHFSMGQKFNWELNDPRHVIGYDYAMYRRESIQFLRSDTAGDYRVAAFEGAPWGSNGCNVWRIRCIYGWNPIMLRDYSAYIRQMVQFSGYAFPYGGPDHRLNSPLFDLLGVKYLLVNGPFEEQQRLPQSPQFEKVFAEPDWRSIYRRKEFISRAWFYPNAYIVPERAQMLALMTSPWFDSRRTLLFAGSDLGRDLPGAERLPAITLSADQIAASSGGKVELDPNCVEPRNAQKYWGGKGNWIRFDVQDLPGPTGRYALLLEYASALEAPPGMVAEVGQADRKQQGPSVVLPRTYGWTCNDTRFAELSQFDLSDGAAQITLTLQTDPGADIFSLTLVRLPDALPAAPQFSFADFDVSASQMSFQADLGSEGFLLINEIFYPGWHATVDDQPAEILPSDYIFRAVAVPAGSHDIEMRFRPTYSPLGAVVSCMTLLGVLSFFLVSRSRHAGQPD